MKEKYIPAPEVEKVARELIVKYHPHLVEANIAYVFKKDSWSKNGKEILGNAHKCSEKEKLLYKHDFIITINHNAWIRFDNNKREAIVDHELCHCGRDVEGKYCSIPHDVEDFADVIKRHGLYKNDVKQFGMAIRQVSLFDKPDLKVVGGNE